MPPESLLIPQPNRLIECLPTRDRARFLDACEPVPLVLSDVLCEAGTPTRHVYFPTEGFISLVSRVDEHPGLEVGMVGSEGMVGSQLMLGVATSPLRALVQGAGTSLRIGVVAFKRELAQSAALQQLLNRY